MTTEITEQINQLLNILIPMAIILGLLCVGLPLSTKMACFFARFFDVDERFLTYAFQITILVLAWMITIYTLKVSTSGAAVIPVVVPKIG